MKKLKSNFENKPEVKEYKWVDKKTYKELSEIPLEYKITAEDMNYLATMVNKLKKSRTVRKS